jgi:pyruvate/2-oxoglutarate dehydrogenase complex dihydrolipoamide acyltransferase (E2) component
VEADKPAPKKAAAKKAAPKKAAPKPEAEAEAPVEVVVDETPAAVETAPVAEFDITDSARELAEEAGLDLATVEGTGKEGRILKSDVQKAIKNRDEA